MLEEKEQEKLQRELLKTSEELKKEKEKVRKLEGILTEQHGKITNEKFETIRLRAQLRQLERLPASLEAEQNRAKALRQESKEKEYKMQMLEAKLYLAEKEISALKGKNEAERILNAKHLRRKNFRLKLYRKKSEVQRKKAAKLCNLVQKLKDNGSSDQEQSQEQSELKMKVEKLKRVAKRSEVRRKRQKEVIDNLKVQVESLEKSNIKVEEQLEILQIQAVDRVPTCEICAYPFTINGARDPKILRCGHTLCGDCIWKLLSDRKRTCPFDRLMALNATVVMHPNNYAILQLIPKSSTGSTPKQDPQK
ncbi:unnamed protein product [Caenorhabditis sp. 36 PRJEB53466]|nr:unnamed protein product [Caenorhabditis sp. 36 PRJEB53466]